MKYKFTKSNKFLKRSLKSIPMASQTFSKSIYQYPYSSTPFFFERGKGSKVWDLDGNCFIDFSSALLSISLGYRDFDVDQAVKKQMLKGVTFSMPHKIETELAELICKIIPSAESVRFAKNGSDATSGAIRLARAYTSKEHIVVCGYHGWQDWYIASTTRDLGIPVSDKKLVHKFKYNNIESLDNIFTKYKNKIAAVIIEPMSFEYPNNNFLNKIKKIAHKNNSVLIFDETITGFRWALGGAQEYFKVTPDLSTFGKGVADGYPLSILVGKKKIMKLMNDIFFSSTFGGETLSLVAAKTVINKMIQEPVIETINKRGKRLKIEFDKMLDKYKLSKILSLKGHYPWLLLNINNTKKYDQWMIKTYLLQELISNGIFFGGSHNINYSHTDKDINFLLKKYDEILPVLSSLLDNESLKKKLKSKPLKPLFKVR